MPAFDDRMSFVSEFAVCHEGETLLPFSVGGVTSHGWHGRPQNNQDAMAIWVDDDLIVCVVSDGCGSAARSSANVMSMNEVGSRLTCLAALGAARNLVRLGVTFDCRFVSGVETRIRRMIRHVVNLGGVGTAGIKEELLLNFVMSTALVAVITAKQYLVMACGDGCIRVNDTVHDLSHMSGVYPANLMSGQSAQEPGYATRSPKDEHHPGDDPPPHQPWFIENGETASLSSLSLATDGTGELFCGSEHLLEQLQACDPQTEYSAGYDAMFFREFRRRVAAHLPTPSTNQIHDDRTLVLVRRIAPFGARENSQVAVTESQRSSVPDRDEVSLAPQNSVEVDAAGVAEQTAVGAIEPIEYSGVASDSSSLPPASEDQRNAADCHPDAEVGPVHVAIAESPTGEDLEASVAAPSEAAQTETRESSSADSMCQTKKGVVDASDIER